jgi:DNA/RNA-binding domain of Phe-tRNA-synthetase-like protein
MMKISFSDEFRAHHPEAIIGVLELSGVDNRIPSQALNDRKREIETDLRNRYQGFSRPDFISIPIMASYRAYYKGFKKSFHLQLQLESLVLKGKPLPEINPLVDANFMAELEHLILTAGHDLNKLNPPIVFDVSKEGDHITLMNGATKPMRSGDMLMRDVHGVSCSVIYGQDNRSPISSRTSHVLYVAYAPAGVSREGIESHFQTLTAHILLFSPQAKIEQYQLFGSQS